MWERNESKWDGEENEKPFNGTIIKSVNGGDGEGGKYNEQRILQVMHDCIMTASLSQNMLYINIRLQIKWMCQTQQWLKTIPVCDMMATCYDKPLIIEDSLIFVTQFEGLLNYKESLWTVKKY